MNVKMHLYREWGAFNAYGYRWYSDDPETLQNLETNPYRGTAEHMETAIIEIPEGYTEADVYARSNGEPEVFYPGGWIYLKRKTIWKK